jgi:hypothetical protein
MHAGAGASDELRRVMRQIIGQPCIDDEVEGKASKEGDGGGARGGAGCHALGGDAGGREGRRASEFAKRRLSLWLSPKEANKSWQLYGAFLFVSLGLS